MTDFDPDSITISNRSGGADLNAQGDITIGGDVVGRDKVVSIAGDNVAGDKNIFTGDQQYDVHGLANPYLGLQSFTYADHAKYAGREKLIVETATRLTASDDPLALLFVTGASGSGKSSFVQAGVLLALEKHYAALSVKWAVFRPSRDPLAALADVIWRQLGLPQFDPSMASHADFGDFLHSYTPPQQVNVIVIDQFEELFTQAAAQPRDALFTLLTQLPPFRSTRTHIIATVRADYLPELFALPTLYDIAKRGIDLRAMSVDELREAIQQPLRATYPDKDKRFQAELIDRLATDAAEDAAYLPLLQVTLEEIWRKGALTLGTYTNLADAIKQRADKVLEFQDYDAAQPDRPRSPEEQAAILNLCLDLVDVSLDDEARRDVRRRRSKDELISGAPERSRLIDALTQARLLSVTAEGGEQPRVEVDLIHETLLSNWDRLRQAITERRHELRQRVRFEQQLKEWIGQNRSDDYLLSGVRLAEASELERHDDVALHSIEAKDFLHRSIDCEEARHQKQLNDARRRVVVFSLVAIVALVAAGIAFFFGDQSSRNADLAERNAATAQAASTLAVANASTAQAASTKAVSEANIRATAEISASIQRDEAQRQARIAFSRQLAAQSVSHLDAQFDLSLLLSTEAVRVEQTIEARRALLDALQYSPYLEAFLQGHTTSVSTLVFGPDGKTLAAGRSDGSIILWDVSNPKSPTQYGTPISGHRSNVLSLAFSPTAKTLASSGSDADLMLWDVSDLKSPSPLSFPFSFAPHIGTLRIIAVNSLVFSPDGKMLAAGSCALDLRPGAYNPLSDCQGLTTLWDVSNPKSPIQLSALFTGSKGDVLSVAFSFQSEKKVLASGNKNGTIILWDISDPRRPVQIGEPLIGHKGDVFSVAFGIDGKILASASRDGTIILWDLSNPKAPSRFGEPLARSTTGIVNSIAFGSLNGVGRLASATDERTITIWTTIRPEFPITLTSIATAQVVTSIAFNPDGQMLATGSLDGSIIVWDMAFPTPLQIGKKLGERWVDPWSVIFSPNGLTLAAGYEDGSITLWDVSDLNSSVQVSDLLTAHRSDVMTLAFSPNSKILASGSNDNTIILWNVSNVRLPSLVSEPLDSQSDEVKSVAFSPDGRVLASGSCGKRSDGRCVEGEIILWDVSDPRSPLRLGIPLSGHKGAVNSVAFSSDGRILASGGCGNREVGGPCDRGEFILWDISNLKSPIPFSVQAAHGGDIQRLAFRSDGKVLASAGEDASVLLWDVTDLQTINLLTDPLSGHRSIVLSVAFSPDGKTLASGSVDERIIVWDVSNPQSPTQLGRLSSHSQLRIKRGIQPRWKNIGLWRGGRRNRFTRYRQQILASAGLPNRRPQPHAYRVDSIHGR